VRLVLLGPPGAGKGSAAQVLSDQLGLVHIASGHLLRDAVRAQTALGRQADGYMQRGELVPDHLVTAMVLEQLEAVAKDRGFVLDGFPRTQAQAVELDAALGRMKMLMDRAIYFKTSPETIVSRLAGRRVCQSCGANYHMTNHPPAVADVCDRCHGTLAQRDDDKPETISQRLKVCLRETEPLLGYYRERGVLRTVNGDESVEAVVRHVIAIWEREQLRFGERR